MSLVCTCSEYLSRRCPNRVPSLPLGGNSCLHFAFGFQFFLFRSLGEGEDWKWLWDLDLQCLICLYDNSLVGNLWGIHLWWLLFQTTGRPNVPYFRGAVLGLTRCEGHRFIKLVGLQQHLEGQREAVIIWSVFFWSVKLPLIPKIYFFDYWLSWLISLYVLQLQLLNLMKWSR